MKNMNASNKSARLISYAKETMQTAGYADAIDAMRSDGLIIDYLNDDEKWHRCPVEKGGKYNKDGSYKVIAGKYTIVLWMNWTIHDKCQQWSSIDRSQMSQKERREYNAYVKQKQEEAEREIAERQTNVAKLARKIWAKSVAAPLDYGYLQRKRIKPGPCRLARNGRLIMPLYDEKGQIVNLQIIKPRKINGYPDKLFLKGGRTSGCYSHIPGPEDAPLLLAEGFATAMSAHMSIGYEAVIALNCHNLLKVAKLERAKFPDRPIVICGDNDKPQPPNYPDQGGIGAFKGRKAAEAIEAFYALCPLWEGHSKADFNDLACELGLPKVREVIEATLAAKPLAARPKIVYKPGELLRIVKEIEASIIGKAWRLDELLVRVTRLPEARSYRGLRQAKGASVISPFEVASFSLLASKCADWMKIKSSAKGDIEIPINPPQEVIQVFLAAKDDWTLPPLTGLVTCPIIRPDGSILNKPGYDAITGLYADFDASFSPVTINPDKSAAIAALNILKAAIDEFPFKTGIDQAVALAAMLTSVLRPSVKSAPLFAFSAPCPGTGKSALADLIGIMATGKPCAAMDFNKDETEFKKALIATLLEGSQVTLVDNIVGELNTSLLNMILSQETISGRILGLSKNAKLATTSLWLATGNNLEICGDLTRRTLLCTLDAGTEKPAERTFKRDIYQWGAANRAELINAALTILLAYHAAGKPLPNGVKPMNGFNDWSHWIRGALLWLGEADPKDSQLEIEAHDPEREALRRVIHAWHEHFGNEFVTAKDLLAREAPNGGQLPDSQVELYQALLEAIPGKGELTSKRLGKWLPRHNGRVIDGLKLIDTGQKDKHSTYWKVVKA